MSRRTPEEQVAEFCSANDRTPVIAGAAIEQNPAKPSRGARYRLLDSRWFYLGAKACRLLPEGYPRWAL